MVKRDAEVRDTELNPLSVDLETSLWFRAQVLHTYYKSPLTIASMQHSLARIETDCHSMWLERGGLRISMRRNGIREEMGQDS